MTNQPRNNETQIEVVSSPAELEALLARVASGEIEIVGIGVLNLPMPVKRMDALRNRFSQN
jgi:hypothetical protein